MSSQHRLNITSIIGIKEGIYQIFSLIGQSLANYGKYPNKIILIKDCKNYMDQMNSLFEILGLNSITLYSEKMGLVIEALIDKKIEPSMQICETLKRSNDVLFHYLNEIIDGVEENPLHLFPSYHELMQIYEPTKDLNRDLFLPRLTSYPVLKPESAHIDANVLKTLVKQISIKYQAGLVKWLRDSSDKSGLQQMLEAVNYIETFPGAIEERAFWWMVAGFLGNFLQYENDQVDVPIRRLCGRIEKAIRHLAIDTSVDNTLLIRDLLYHIAYSKSTNQHIADIKHSYAWPWQLAKTDMNVLELSQTLQLVLDQLRIMLMKVNYIWREFCAGRQESLAFLPLYLERFKHLSQQAQCPALGKLTDIIISAVNNIHARPQDMKVELAMEITASFLLVEYIIDDFAKLSPELPQQIDALTCCVNETMNQGVGRVWSTFSVIADKTHEKRLIPQVAQEIQVNLEQIENLLDQFFFEPSTNPELSIISVSFKQISAALLLLNMERANTLLDLCQGLVVELLEPHHDIIDAQQILLVDGLSSLGFFIEAHKSGQPDSYQIIEEAIALFEIARSLQKISIPKTIATAISGA